VATFFRRERRDTGVVAALHAIKAPVPFARTTFLSTCPAVKLTNATGSKVLVSSAALRRIRVALGKDQSIEDKGAISAGAQRSCMGVTSRT
jgi:hypothetical protein